MEQNIAERQRLEEAQDNKVAWRKWGPYLNERQWGTVREDYSENGDANSGHWLRPYLTIPATNFG